MSDPHDLSAAAAGQPRNRESNHVVVEIAVAGLEELQLARCLHASCSSMQVRGAVRHGRWVG